MIADDERLIAAVKDLFPISSNVIEESRRITVEGAALNKSIRHKLVRILDISKKLSISPVLTISEERDNDLSDSMLDGEPWRLVIGKSTITQHLKARDNEDTLLFFSVKGFHEWLKNIDPFIMPSTDQEPDFCSPITIRILGLEKAFGGELLWVLPVGTDSPVIESESCLPSISDVHGLVHINAIDKSLRICPNGFAVTWGLKDNIAAIPLINKSAVVLSACLVQEIKRIEGRYEAILSGTKRVSLPLIEPEELEDLVISLDKLREAVCWVYEERSETRLKLIMDRLSIDSQIGDSLLSCIRENLDAALQQARDSYAFVILERKDAYHKEMRELMKDMKSQADLYAVKVRDLVASFTRDILGVLVFIGFSFLGKFDHQHLVTVLVSSELSLFLKFLACYLAFSSVLQLITHYRDSSLSYKESEKWLDVLQDYTSRKEKEETFLKLLNKRRSTLHTAMFLSGIFYLILVFVVWNLPCIVRLLLNY